MPSPSLRLAAGTARREIQLNTRGAGFWLLAGAGMAYALWRGTTPGATAALTCYQVVQAAVTWLGVVAVLLGGAAAGRDARDKSLELVLAKPVGTSSMLVAARFVGVWLSLLLVVVMMLAAALIGQVISGGEPWNIAAYGSAVEHSLAPLGLAAALGFTLTTVLVTPLAAAIAAVYWVSIPMARVHLPAILDLTVLQHWPVAALLGAGLVALSMARHGVKTAGSGPGARRAGWAAGVLFALTAAAALAIIGQGEDALLNPNRVLEKISGQTGLVDRRAPGFWLADARGQVVGLSDFDGRPALLVFWGPGSPVTAQALTALQTVARRHAAERVACIAICIDKDQATLGPFAREVSPQVVMLQDRGRHFNAGQVLADSAVANAYAVEYLPNVFMLDRDRIIVGKSGIAETQALELLVASHLRGPGAPRAAPTPATHEVPISPLIRDTRAR